MLAKFHGNKLNLSGNIAKSFRGATFFDSHCIYHIIRPNSRSGHAAYLTDIFLMRFWNTMIIYNGFNFDFMHHLYFIRTSRFLGFVQHSVK